MYVNESDFVASTCVVFIVLLELCFVFLKLYSLHSMVRASYFDIHQSINHV